MYIKTHLISCLIAVCNDLATIQMLKGSQLVSQRHRQASVLGYVPDSSQSVVNLHVPVAGSWRKSTTMELGCY